MKRLLVAVAALTCLATPVMAKEGVYVGAYAIPSSELTGADTGTGYGFRAGIGFNRYLSIEGSYEKTSQDIAGISSDLTGVAADIKINFPLTSLDSSNVMTLEPYFRLGYGINYNLKPDNGQSDSGNGARIGVGIELYLFRELSVNAGWTRTDISFDRGDGSLRAFDVGLNYHFF